MGTNEGSAQGRRCLQDWASCSLFCISLGQVFGANGAHCQRQLFHLRNSILCFSGLPGGVAWGPWPLKGGGWLALVLLRLWRASLACLKVLLISSFLEQKGTVLFPPLQGTLSSLLANVMKCHLSLTPVTSLQLKTHAD